MHYSGEPSWNHRSDIVYYFGADSRATTTTKRQSNSQSYLRERENNRIAMQCMATMKTSSRMKCKKLQQQNLSSSLSYLQHNAAQPSASFNILNPIPPQAPRQSPKQASQTQTPLKTMPARFWKTQLNASLPIRDAAFCRSPWL